MSTSSSVWSADRFTKLFAVGAENLRQGTVREFEHTGYVLRVLKGRHIGAMQALDEPSHTVGAELDNDLVLLDLHDINLRIEKKGVNYVVLREEPLSAAPAVSEETVEGGVDEVTLDAVAAPTSQSWSPVSPVEHYERPVAQAQRNELPDLSGTNAHSPSPESTDRYELCDVYVFDHVAFEIVTLAELQPPDSMTETKASRKGTTTKALFATGFFAVTGIVYAISLALSHDDPSSAAIRSNTALAQSKFGNVQIRRAIDGGAEFAGIVADERELAALNQWARANALSHIPVRVLRLDKFRDKLSESLSGADVKVQQTNAGSLRVDGNVKSPAISARLNAIIKEIGSAANIENKLVVTPDVPQTVQVLPFRVATFRPGSPGYVELDGGLRYFEGSVTPEGYEVLSVSATSARFSRGGKESVFSLN